MMGTVTDGDMTPEEFDRRLDAGEPVRMRRRKRPVSVIRDDVRIVTTKVVKAQLAISANAGITTMAPSQPRVTGNLILSGSSTT